MTEIGSVSLYETSSVKNCYAKEEKRKKLRDSRLQRLKKIKEELKGGVKDEK